MVSSLNEALLRVIRDRVPKRTIVAITDEKSWVENRRVLTQHAKERAYTAWSRSKTQATWEEDGEVRRLFTLCIWILNEHSLRGANNS